jgi:uncharacterized membrane protein YbjE (DUF340 family)
MIKYIVSALVFGVVAGYLNGKWGNVYAGGFVSDYLFAASLVLLLFLMGVSFGSDREAMVRLRKTGLKVFVFPIAIAAGSIVGGLVGGLVLGVNVVASMALCGGYGWYTLAGPLMVQLYGAEWGALGFSVNFLRELLTIVTVSVAVKVDRFAPVAFGGATTMDTTLPVIVRYCGDDMLITAFSSGFVLSAVAPLSIVALASLS